MDPRKKWSETMARVGELNESHGVQQKGGKKYTQVVHRMEALREHHGLDFGVSTEILVDDGTRVVMKAIIHTNDLPAITLGTGHAEELRGEGMVNKTSAIENCETSAIGRALASIGLGGGEYASANEMDGVQRKTEAKQTQKKPAAAGPKPVQSFEGGLEKALRYIFEIDKISTKPQLQAWVKSHQAELDRFDVEEPAQSKSVMNALEKRFAALNTATETGLPEDARTHGTEPDPTPAPSATNTNDENTPPF